MRKRVIGLVVLGWIAAAAGTAWTATAPPSSPDDAAADVLKRRCIRCHGPALSQGGLDLTQPAPRGKSGPTLTPGKPEQSLLWRRVVRGEMPPGEPLPATERGLLRQWIVRIRPQPSTTTHWAFGPLRARLPTVKDARRVRTSVDRYLQTRLEAARLALGPDADRHTLIRRVSFDLTGLPPSPEEIRTFLTDSRPRAYEAMVERYLASPRYGERWAQHWLDAAGYADSNGYFNADTDRPLAYRYRDYVVRAIREDRPWDAFIREQLAGDELAGYGAGQAVAPSAVPLLEATHFLRNSADGTDSSDGNPDEQRADKYAALEGTAQIIGSSLLGLTVQCARCHDHKFEPFTQRDYYQLQAILYPAFHIEKWVKPGQRVMETAGADELARWSAAIKEADGRVADLRRVFADWARQNPEPGRTLFEDPFDGASLAERWSNTAPGDSRPAGTPPVAVDARGSPAARIESGRLRIIESGAAGDRALATRRSFDWTPDREGAWIEVTFELPAEAPSAPYIGFFVALRDFNDERPSAGGSVLIDGNAAGGAAVHVDYPGADSQGRGKIGKSGFVPGRTYGVRITHRNGGGYELAQIVDGFAEVGTVVLNAGDLPDGAFGFEYCCGRSFTVDNVRVRESDPDPAAAEARGALAAERSRRREALEAAVREIERARPARPGQVAAVTDVVSAPPEVRLLERGEYKLRGPAVPAAAPAFLRDRGESETLDLPGWKGPGTGRRLAFARWLTRPGSRPAALLARVTVNRCWQHYFGTGLARTAENLGLSGSRPSHPELLDHLAQRLVASGWSAKALHRLILHSTAYRQSSRPSPEAVRKDEENRLLSRFPLRRLDAEAIRDAMLAAAGDLDPQAGGPYVPTTRRPDGDVVVDETAGGRRRSLYLQRRRTQVPGILEVFDAPSIVVNCTGRSSTTVPLQSLKLLNSEFIRLRARGLAARAGKEAADDARLDLAFLLTAGRPPRDSERRAARRFLAEQPGRSGPGRQTDEAAWIDLCQMLLASNAFLYLE